MTKFGGTNKFFLYVAIGGGLCIGLLSLLSIRWNFGGDVIRQGLTTYWVTLLAFWGITVLPVRYEKFSKVNPATLNSIIWLGTISILVVAFLSYLTIWNLMEADDFYWKVISTILIVNFVAFACVFSLEKWWGNDDEKDKDL